SNNRVLIWNSVPTSSGVAADLVLGQGDFTHCVQNDDNQDTAAEATPTGRTLYYPAGIWSDGNRLVIADASNNRILIWTTFPRSNFEAANIVLGQASLTTNTGAAGDTGLKYPYFVGSNGNQLFAADTTNNRVMIWDTFPSVIGAAASAVLGQSNFTHVKANDD